MKKIAMFGCCVVALALMVGFTGAEEKEAWFDIEGCSICKHLGAEEGLLHNMSWETKLIKNGTVTVTMVPAEYEEAFQRAETHMTEAAGKMQTGEPMHVCGFCQSFGKLMMSGVKVEALKGESARITLMISSDEKVVAMIHEHAQKTIDAYEEWAAEEAKAKG